MTARSFKNKEVKEKKKRISKAAIFAIIIGSVMILSTIGFSLTNNSDQGQKYNGFSFERSGNFWLLQKIDQTYLDQHPTKAKLLKPFGYPSVPKTNLYFSAFPSQLETLDVDNASLDLIKNSKVIYISFYPNSTSPDSQYVDFVRFQLAKDLQENFNIYVVQAKAQEELVAPGSVRLDFPIIDCNNATAFAPVIMIKKSENSTSLKAQGSCVVMESANGYDLVFLRDRITYGLLGVIK